MSFKGSPPLELRDAIHVANVTLTLIKKEELTAMSTMTTKTPVLVRKTLFGLSALTAALIVVGIPAALSPNTGAALQYLSDGVQVLVEDRTLIDWLKLVQNVLIIALAGSVGMLVVRTVQRIAERI